VFLADTSELGELESDEGGAQLTRTGTMMGTPYFMSPEQARGRNVDHRTDVYALGVLIYRMFCDRYPFEGESFMVIVAQHMNDEPPKPSEVTEGRVAGELEAVILKALEKEVEVRHQSVAELLAALEAIPATLVPRSEVPAPPAAQATPVSTPMRAATPPPASAPTPTPTPTPVPGAAAPSGTLHLTPVPATQPGKRSSGVPAAAEASAAPSGEHDIEPLPPVPEPGPAPAPARKTGLLVAVALVLAVAAGGGAFMLLRGKGEPAKVDVAPLLRLPEPRGFKRGHAVEPLPEPTTTSRSK